MLDESNIVVKSDEKMKRVARAALYDSGCQLGSWYVDVLAYVLFFSGAYPHDQVSIWRRPFACFILHRSYSRCNGCVLVHKDLSDDLFIPKAYT
ncbi:hypothetical protein LZ31DRAFT_554877 [Colletotrichum somersetense]|nr:hypothetical protein LZ31DRAFT_554877 [Colletotrichum somersetense]